MKHGTLGHLLPGSGSGSRVAEAPGISHHLPRAADLALTPGAPTRSQEPPACSPGTRLPCTDL